MKIEFPLQKDGYNPFIDYMKGWAILAVVLQHAVMLPGFEFTMMQAVPLFLLIQIFHCYKHGLDNCRAFNFSKTWHRILKPFIITQLIIVFIAMLSSSNSLRVIVKNILLGGGTGPGSYYPWIYIQFAILLPIIGKALRGMSLVVRGGYLLAASIISEILFVYLRMPDYVWRLLSIRYFFLIFLGMVWVEKGLQVNIIRITLMFVSLLFISIFSFMDINLRPLFIQTGWKQCHWISYFWVSFGIPPMLWWLWKHSIESINTFICKLGKFSWEIFLIQMFVFKFVHQKKFNNIFGESLGMPIFVIFTIMTSILPVLIYKHYYVKTPK